MSNCISAISAEEALFLLDWIELIVWIVTISEEKGPQLCRGLLTSTTDPTKGLNKAWGDLRSGERRGRETRAERRETRAEPRS